MLLLSEDSEVARLNNKNNSNNEQTTTTKTTTADGMWLLSEDSEVVLCLDSGNTLIHSMATSTIVNPAGKKSGNKFFQLLMRISVFASVDFS